MSAYQQSLVEWVTQLNDTLFIQPNDALALKAIEEQVDTSLITKINHNVYTYDQFKPGLLYVRSTSTTTQDTFSVLLTWENPEFAENSDGVVAVRSETTTTDNGNGKETKKKNIILWDVKLVDGVRKLVGQTEVEA
ncbi:hypothetical protein IQ07DRAFT_618986 [Pyrenochaeta sp. DS3sAY3a]|nr:hypothetical protein IQ07DRAFT_618986 [Pyrenochaeta sp. DS3sAY3a]